MNSNSTANPIANPTPATASMSSNWYGPAGRPLICDPRLINQTADAPQSPMSIQTNGTAGLPLGDGLQRIRELERLKLDWDSYGSEPPTQWALAAARTLILEVSENSKYLRVPFAIMPLSGGGVQIEWRGATDSIEVEITAEGLFNYLLVRGSGSERHFAERDDVSKSHIVELILSCV
jgi:hypothetical protein